ncbi:MAG: bifunctional oligoribonuclease/PAP phosphatase NrnA [Candidatus Latescibacteria bacterium]|jgi:bifunctional oligoribonuclease and PAP phosphatase NrnA|nr:bifunctional oligoribonuclease/PAP phosphatase NrnA [Candidatus Latescibacterota bacterium]MBT4140168.1 bifunctional oligoribonuclease/PAP phosphatase NrnA [Candidatus Latescibacterota bacterium]
MMDVEEALAFFDVEGPYLLTTHVNADGDGVGAVLGLAHWLTQTGRSYQIVIHDEKPDPKFGFLPGFENLTPCGAVENTKHFTRAVVLDTPTMSERRIGDVANLITNQTRTLIMDHHAGDLDEGDVRFIDSDASAASELVYHLICASGEKLSRDMATCLYAGIAFDTKLFKHSHPERALPVCADLASSGADPQQIAEDLFSHQTLETIATLGFALSHLTLHAQGRISTLYIDHATYTKGGDLDPIVDHAMSIDGVEVALLFKEDSPGRQRVSLRSRGGVDVNAVANQFDGGGHQRASGCTIDSTLESARDQLLAAVEKHL